MRDVALSQRNIVFPDTAANEARFFRNLISGKLSAVQGIGLILFCGIVAGPILYMAKGMISAVGALFLGGCGAAFLLLRWKVRRAIREPRISRNRGVTLSG